MSAVLKPKSQYEQILADARHEIAHGRADDAIANAIHIEGDAVVAYLQEGDGIINRASEAISNLDGHRYDKLAALLESCVRDDVDLTQATQLVELLGEVIVDATRDGLRRRLERELA